MLSELFKQAATKGDWAIALSAALLGYILDAAFDLIPLPAFTPEICAIVGVGIALATKRSVEAIIKLSQDRRLLALHLREAGRVAGLLDDRSLVNDADALRFAREAAVIRPDLDTFITAIEAGRRKL